MKESSFATCSTAARSCARLGCTARSSARANGSTAPSGRVTRFGGATSAHLLGRGGQDLAADAAGAVGVVDHHQPAGAFQRLGQPVPVERVQRARVEHLHRHLLGQLLGDRQRVVHQMADRDHRDVGRRAGGPGPRPSGTGARVAKSTSSRTPSAPAGANTTTGSSSRIADSSSP